MESEKAYSVYVSPKVLCTEVVGSLKSTSPEVGGVRLKWSLLDFHPVSAWTLTTYRKFTSAVDEAG